MRGVSRYQTTVRRQRAHFSDGRKCVLSYHCMRLYSCLVTCYELHNAIKITHIAFKIAQSKFDFVDPCGKGVAFCCVVCSFLFVRGFMCEEPSPCVMTLLLSSREWQPLTEGISIPRIPFADEALCPGRQAVKSPNTVLFFGLYVCMYLDLLISSAFSKVSLACSIINFRICISVFRIVRMVMTLREWAQKSLNEEAERPDSFLERFRGPAQTDMLAPPSRFSHSHTGSEADAEIRRPRCM